MACDSLLTTSLLQVVNIHNILVAKLIVKGCYPQACCKLFQQVVTSLQVTTNSILTDFSCCNLIELVSFLQLVDKLQQASKIDNLQQVCGVSGRPWYINTSFHALNKDAGSYLPHQNISTFLANDVILVHIKSCVATSDHP